MKNNLIDKVVERVHNLKQNSYTVSEFASMIGMSVDAARVLVKRENLCFKIGGKNFVKREKAEAYLRKILEDGDN